MGLLSFIFGNNQKLPFKKSIRFERKNLNFQIDIGEKLNIWNKPNTDQINFYAKGTSDGDGLLGTVTNSVISKHLNQTQNICVENKVIGVTNSFIEVDIHIYLNEKTTEEIQEEYKKKWFEKLNKKYNPKTSWDMRFYSENEIKENDFLIKTINKSQIEEFYQRNDETIWLTDKKGQKLLAENQIGTIETVKTLRAVFSGHELEILNFRKDNNYYHLEIGIKIKSKSE